jgi:hypothetical protein
MSRGVIAVAVLISAGYVNPTRGHVGDTTLAVELQNLVDYQVAPSDSFASGNDSQCHLGQHRCGDGAANP